MKRKLNKSKSLRPNKLMSNDKNEKKNYKKDLKKISNSNLVNH
jgi:hypothetical protein